MHHLIYTVVCPSMPSLTNAASVYSVGTLRGRHVYMRCMMTTCRFVELVEELAHQGIVQQLGITPVMRFSHHALCYGPGGKVASCCAQLHHTYSVSRP